MTGSRLSTVYMLELYSNSFISLRYLSGRPYLMLETASQDTSMPSEQDPGFFISVSTITIVRYNKGLLENDGKRRKKKKDGELVVAHRCSCGICTWYTAAGRNCPGEKLTSTIKWSSTEYLEEPTGTGWQRSVWSRHLRENIPSLLYSLRLRVFEFRVLQCAGKQTRLTSRLKP